MQHQIPLQVLDMVDMVAAWEAEVVEEAAWEVVLWAVVTKVEATQAP
uniref:Uncharacterized protein n=1 Tax=Parascaris equorum TaxID=6256 RepID=A0A914RW90_PAREQ